MHLKLEFILFYLVSVIETTEEEEEKKKETKTIKIEIAKVYFKTDIDKSLSPSSLTHSLSLPFPSLAWLAFQSPAIHSFSSHQYIINENCL